MDFNSGGQSSDNRQRQTASDIARRKVLAAYGGRRTFSNTAIAHAQAQAERHNGVDLSKNQNKNYSYAFNQNNQAARPTVQTYTPISNTNFNSQQPIITTHVQPTTNNFNAAQTITSRSASTPYVFSSQKPVQAPTADPQSKIPAYLRPALKDNNQFRSQYITNQSANTTDNHGTSAYTSATKTPPQTYTDTAANDQKSEIGSYKQAPSNANETKQSDLQKYHSAWQNYYQKYYSDYYSKAARQYVETERLKVSREKQDVLRNGEERDARNYVKSDLSEASVDQIELTLREKIQKKADGRFHVKKKHKKFIPLFAGIAVALVVLFLQYNRLIFAPIMAYISPGNVSDTGISEIDPTVNENISPNPKLYIPKLNVEVPVAFGISNDTATINEAMNNGVAHFRTGGANAFPGQYGNTVISGHSAGDIYSNNQYKFIFSGLERLVNGDLLYIDYQGVRYTYQMFDRKTVEPSDVAALDIGEEYPYLTLITCTPLGTSRYRLLIFAKQINPAVETATAKSKEKSSNTNMPSNEKTFFENVFGN